MRASVDHPSVGEVEMAGIPMHFSRTPATVRRHPPELGEHTVDVLAELGYSDEEIVRFHDEGVV